MKKIIVYLYEKPVLLFLTFTIVAFLPVLLPFFYLKNDLVTQILPSRFIISESIHSGFSPWWNPYINYGIPQYSDMASGFWNPILWIISIFFRYNIWIITFEEIFYIFLSGWGMFLVLKELGASKKISILSGFSYMCSGYIIGHMQHFCWITGAAFFPYIFLYFVRINKKPTLRNMITGSVFAFLFLSSTHPGLIIGALYYFFFCILAILLFKKSLLRGKIHTSVLRNNLCFLAITTVLSLCVIISYLEILPFFTRGERLSMENSITNPTTFQSYISLLFPLIVHKTAIFNTDISMRNVYTGLLSLCGIFFFFKKFNSKIVIYSFFCLLFFIIISSEGFLKNILNTITPLAAYVRLSGEFFLFPVFILIIGGALGFQFIDMRQGLILKWRWGFKAAAAIFIASLAGSIILIFLTKDSILFIPKSPFSLPIKEYIKHLVDDSSIWDLLFIQSCLNLSTIYFLSRAITRKNTLSIAAIISINLIAICWLTLPFTGIGAKSKKEVHAILSSAPEGISTQPLEAVNDFIISDSNYIVFTGLPYTYMKKIGTPVWNPYAIQLNNNSRYFNDSQTVKFINQQPYLFLSVDTSIKAKVNGDSLGIDVKISGPGYIKAVIRNDQFNYITLLQNNYPHWQVFIDGKQVAHFTGYKTFISAEIPHKSFMIEYKFIPKKIVNIAWVNLVIFLIAMMYLLFLWTKPFVNKNNF